MSFNYVDTPNPNLVCCICRAPFTFPYTTQTCSHTFCRECIFTALKINQQCPIDRSALRPENLLPADSVLRNLVDELPVECPNRPAGCEETPQRQLVDMHLRDECQYGEVPCPDGKCEKTILRKDAMTHTHGRGDSMICSECGQEITGRELESHMETCKDRTTTCSDCLSTIPAMSLSAHKRTCPDSIIPCTHSPNGCPWTGRRGTLHTTHIPTCPYESIKGFFALNDQKFSALTQENVQLKYEINVLQGMVAIMQKELVAVKRVLGPWYQGPDGNARGATSTSPVVSSPEEQYAEELAAFVEGSSADLSFASYFPPAQEDLLQGVSSIDSTLNYPQQQHRVPASSTPSTVHPLPSSLRSRPPPGIPINSLSVPPSSSIAPSSTQSLPGNAPASTPIAPLNISTTLYGTLSSLHTSLLTVSSSLDSLGRHQDVALTTETMRMGEEVRSLRAVVSGLRMQVHAIMVDRNAQVTLGGGRPPALGVGVGIGGSAGVGSGSSETTGIPGPVSAATMQQHPGMGYQHVQFPAIPGVGESGLWPAPTYFGLPLPRFSTQGTSSQPVTKL